MQRLGCLTPLGIASALLTAVLVAVIGLSSGGAMFNPGGLSATGGAQYGGVTNHAELGGNCAACHVDPWSSRAMNDQCRDCHTDIQSQLQDTASLHAAMPEATRCRDCHTEHNGPRASLTRLNLKDFPHERLGFSLAAHRRMSNGQPFACADCHAQERVKFDAAQCETCHIGYQRDFVAAHVADFGQDCLACHDGVDRFTRFDHGKTAFALNGGHLEAKCRDCHQNARTFDSFKSTPQACFACHAKDDEHEGRFGQDCGQCHTPEKWDRVTFDHDQAAFKLIGKHADVECTKCHVNNVFKGTPQTCVECHQKQDKHNGSLGTDCVQCHTPEGWGKVTFDHSQAAFPLTGAHLKVECAKCHVDNVFKSTPQNCVACHQKDDEHNGQFGTDCGKCHSTDAWQGAKFDHNLAAFKLTGAHVNVECKACHVNAVFKGTPQTCAACHADPDVHRGQFGTDCAQCHTTNNWQDVNFAHQFPLNHGEQGIIACATCHTVPRDYKTYTCYGCHEHDPARIQTTHLEKGIADFVDCNRCHARGQKEEGGD